MCALKNPLTSLAEVAEVTSAVTTASTAPMIRWFHTHRRWYSSTRYDCQETEFQLSSSPIHKAGRTVQWIHCGTNNFLLLCLVLRLTSILSIPSSCNNCQFVDRCINFKYWTLVARVAVYVTVSVWNSVASVTRCWILWFLQRRTSYFPTLTNSVIGQSRELLIRTCRLPYYTLLCA